MRRRQTAALILCAALLLSGCAARSTALLEDEMGAFNAIFSLELSPSDMTDITKEALSEGRAGKFRAVTKVYEAGESGYAMVCEPVAYNGPVRIAVGIDGDGVTKGVRILGHSETDHYVRNFEDEWFTGRFAGKNTDTYLKVSLLEAAHESDIIAITGATVTTQGVVNGVNAAMGLYREAILGEEAPPVDYMASDETPFQEVLEEKGTIAVRAENTVLGEVSLEDIREMPSVRRKMVIHSSEGDTTHDFRGTLLLNVLNAVAPGINDNYSWVRTVGVDDYMSDISMDEVNMENQVYLMYEDWGEPIARKDGTPGGMRVVVLDDMFGQRFTNYMVEVIVE